MCDMCFYEVECRVCGGTYKQHGSPNNSEPCGPCTRWFIRTVIKLIFKPGFMLPSSIVNYYNFLEVKAKTRWIAEGHVPSLHIKSKVVTS